MIKPEDGSIPALAPPFTQPQKAVVNNQLHLAYYMESVTKEQIIIMVDASTNRILNGEYCFVH